MNTRKQGTRKPISKKNQAAINEWSHEDVYSNPLAVSKELHNVLKKRGVGYRFISAVQLKKNQGFHKAGWRPLQLTAEEKKELSNEMGISDNGSVIRGDCILAIKSEEEVERQRRYLAAKAARYSKAVDKKEAQGLKEMAKSYGSGIRVHEGYDD